MELTQQTVAGDCCAAKYTKTRPSGQANSKSNRVASVRLTTVAQLKMFSTEQLFAGCREETKAERWQGQPGPLQRSVRLREGL
jgi:hypothetical protein